MGPVLYVAAKGKSDTNHENVGDPVFRGRTCYYGESCKCPQNSKSQTHKERRFEGGGQKCKKKKFDFEGERGTPDFSGVEGWAPLVRGKPPSRTPKVLAGEGIKDTHQEESQECKEKLSGSGQLNGRRDSADDQKGAR